MLGLSAAFTRSPTSPLPWSLVRLGVRALADESGGEAALNLDEADTGGVEGLFSGIEGFVVVEILGAAAREADGLGTEAARAFESCRLRSATVMKLFGADTGACDGVTWLIGGETAEGGDWGDSFGVFP